MVKKKAKDAKRSARIREVARKMSTKFSKYLKRDNKFGKIYCVPSSAQFCTTSVQHCAKFRRLAWEGIWHSGWKFSILTLD